MNWKMWLLSVYLAVVLPVAAEPQSSASKPSKSNYQMVVVPVPVAALILPILDEKQISGQHDQGRLSNLVYALTGKKGRAADEAMVVLMCFDVGESQEETDAVIARGKRMLPLLKKYQDKNPKIPGRTYPDLMLKGTSSKADAFEGAIKAIKHGWHSTADNPEG
jgi:hypothetical protein